jgi:hypothetical protein
MPALKAMTWAHSPENLRQVQQPSELWLGRLSLAFSESRRRAPVVDPRETLSAPEIEGADGHGPCRDYHTPLPAPTQQGQAPADRLRVSLP